MESKTKTVEEEHHHEEKKEHSGGGVSPNGGGGGGGGGGASGSPNGGGHNVDRESIITDTKPVEWSPENENILVEWGDVAQCYKWMNSASHEQYSNYLAWFTIPTIILSTISGTASFAQGSVPHRVQMYAPVVIGTINIFVGILTTIQQYLKIAERNESHRVSAISWDKFSRNIRIELAKAPNERMEAGHFIKMCRQEYDRLMETSPVISREIIQHFNRKFAGKTGRKERARLEEIKKPDILDINISTNNSRHGWYKELSSPSSDYGELNKELDIAFKEKTIIEKEEFINAKEKELYLKEIEECKRIRQKEESKTNIQKSILDALRKFKEDTNKINTYVNGFQEMYGRKPFTDEIMDNLKDEVPLDVMDEFLETYTIENVANIV
jgi:hypothetical protein